MAADLLLASRVGLLSIVGVVLALGRAGTVLLALLVLLVLGKRLHLLQVVGLAPAAGGVVLIVV